MAGPAGNGVCAPEVFPVELALREVWGYVDAVITRTIDTHIAELRRKLEEDASTPRHILTVRKVGYRLKE